MVELITKIWRPILKTLKRQTNKLLAYCCRLIISQGPLFLEFDSKRKLGDQISNFKTIFQMRESII